MKSFSPLAGIGCLSTESHSPGAGKCPRKSRHVSVPSRGLVVFLQVYAYWDGKKQARTVSVPSRGLVVFLPRMVRINGHAGQFTATFQSPRGDWLSFYSGVSYADACGQDRFSPLAGIGCLSTRCSPGTRTPDPPTWARFSPLAGIGCLSTSLLGKPPGSTSRFSPLAGIGCLSTGDADGALHGGQLFQSPRGDWLSFYPRVRVCNMQCELFQSPRGDWLSFYPECSATPTRTPLVSVPSRGLVVFLPDEERLLRAGRQGFSPLAGIGCLSTERADFRSLLRLGRGSFSPLAGIGCLSTNVPVPLVTIGGLNYSFSPLAGIGCLSTRQSESWPLWPSCFSPLAGIGCLSTRSRCADPCHLGKVSVPSRGLVVFLHAPYRQCWSS
jgi:hypothetical protein